jgi:hypothetical protein
MVTSFDCQRPRPQLLVDVSYFAQTLVSRPAIVLYVRHPSTHGQACRGLSKSCPALAPAAGTTITLKNRVAFGSVCHEHRLLDVRGCFRRGFFSSKGESHANSDTTMALLPHYLSEDKSDMRGTKVDWYAMEDDSGFLGWGRSHDRSDG